METMSNILVIKYLIQGECFVNHYSNTGNYRTTWLDFICNSNHKNSKISTVNSFDIV